MAPPFEPEEIVRSLFLIKKKSMGQTTASLLDLGNVLSRAGTVPVGPLKGTNLKQQQQKRKIQELSDDNTSPPPPTKVRIAGNDNDGGRKIRCRIIPPQIFKESIEVAMMREKEKLKSESEKLIKLLEQLFNDKPRLELVINRIVSNIISQLNYKKTFVCCN